MAPAQDGAATPTPKPRPGQGPPSLSRSRAASHSSDSPSLRADRAIAGTSLGLTRTPGPRRVRRTRLGSTTATMPRRRGPPRARVLRAQRRSARPPAAALGLAAAALGGTGPGPAVPARLGRPECQPLSTFFQCSPGPSCRALEPKRAAGGGAAAARRGCLPAAEPARAEPVPVGALPRSQGSSRDEPPFMRGAQAAAA